MSRQSENRNRLDHILPQGYLEGFTTPSKKGRLWVFDIERRMWFPSSPASVAAERGYYDYSESSQPTATADQAFAQFENRFPPLRRELVATNFFGWKTHVDFLVRYAQMLRARSALFRQEVFKEANEAKFLKVEKVSGKTIRYSQIDMQSDPARDTFFKNMCITRMRAEIQNGAGQFAGWNWHLRLTDDVTSPVITADNPIVLVGFGSGLATREEGIKDQGTLLVFPLCWQAYLIGCRQQFEERGPVSPEMQAGLHRCYLNDESRRFAYSPHQVT